MGVAAVGASAASADTVAINFMGDGYGAIGAPVTATAYGVGVADWTDVDPADASGSTAVSGINFAWTINNDWNQGIAATAGDGEVNNGYLDDGGGAAVNITGLAAWLAGTGDTTYTVQGIQSSDNAESFSDIQLLNGVGNVGTLTNSAAGPRAALGGETSLSAGFTFDQLEFDVDDRAGAVRGTLSGIIITSVSTSIPEPGSAMIVAVTLGLGVIRRRKK